MRSTDRCHWLSARPIAHRGLHDSGRGAVENTAVAFQRAVDRGYAIECDLQLAGDGEAMVFHDFGLARLTEATGPVRGMTSAALKLVPFRAGADRMQTLGELLEQVNGRVPLVIELKSRFDGDTLLAARAVRALEGYRGEAALMSFDPALVAAVRHAAPEMPRGIVADAVTHPEWRALPLPRRHDLRYMRHLDETDPDFLSYDVAGLPSPPSRLFRTAGRPVICWTVRSPAQMERARCWADQITFEGFLPPVPAS